MTDKLIYTEGDDVVKQFADHIKDKTVLVTGAGKGSIGGETAVAIAKAQPKLIILHARSEERLTEIAKAVNEAGVPTRYLLIDLNSFAAIREGAKTVASWDDVAIDVVIHNASVMTTPWGKTADGFETQFGINHLALFLFTNLILKAGKIANGGRIVNVTSTAYEGSGIRWDDYNFQDGAVYDRQTAYAQSKTANILYAVSLADKLKSKGITAYSCHPGVVNSQLGRYLTREEFANIVQWCVENLTEDFNGTLKTLNQGAACQITAAFSPDISGQSGAFLMECRIKQQLAHAAGLENAERLWKLSEDLVGEKFDF